jgi:hypothetical protein
MKRSPTNEGGPAVQVAAASEEARVPLDAHR